MDLSVVILNWNARAFLEKCLRSLTCPQPGITFEVVVVDNASGDDSRETVQERFPQFRLLVNSQNLGFGAGNNAAIPQTNGRYILFLNSDTEIVEDALAAMVRFADGQPDIGIVGAKLLNGDGSLQFSCRRYPNLLTGFFRNTPLGRLFPNNHYAADYLMQNWDHAEPRDVDWVSGAALMIRRELIAQIGGFDEDFFMYCEDVDLCWRANHAPTPQPPPPKTGEGEQNTLSVSPLLFLGEGSGVRAAHWRVTYFPDAVIYHLIGKSSDQVPTRMTYEFHRSQYLFYAKHYRQNTPLLVRPIIPVGIALRAVGQMTRYRVRYWQRKMAKIGKRSVSHELTTEIQPAESKRE